MNTSSKKQIGRAESHSKTTIVEVNGVRKRIRWTGNLNKPSFDDVMKANFKILPSKLSNSEIFIQNKDEYRKGSNKKKIPLSEFIKKKMMSDGEHIVVLFQLPDQNQSPSRIKENPIRKASKDDHKNSKYLQGRSFPNPVQTNYLIEEKKRSPNKNDSPQFISGTNSEKNILRTGISKSNSPSAAAEKPRTNSEEKLKERHLSLQKTDPIGSKGSRLAPLNISPQIPFRLTRPSGNASKRHLEVIPIFSETHTRVSKSTQKESKFQTQKLENGRSGQKEGLSVLTNLRSLLSTALLSYPLVVVHSNKPFKVLRNIIKLVPIGWGSDRDSIDGDSEDFKEEDCYPQTDEDMTRPVFVFPALDDSDTIEIFFAETSCFVFKNSSRMVDILTNYLDCCYKNSPERASALFAAWVSQKAPTENYSTLTHSYEALKEKINSTEAEKNLVLEELKHETGSDITEERIDLILFLISKYQKETVRKLLDENSHFL